MDDLSLAAEAYADYDNQNHIQFQYLPAMSAWPLPLDPTHPNPDDLQAHDQLASAHHPHAHHDPTGFYNPVLNASRPDMAAEWYQSTSHSAQDPRQQQHQSQQHLQHPQHPPPTHQQQHHLHQHSLVHGNTYVDQQGQQVEIPFTSGPLQHSPMSYISQQPVTLSNAMHMPYTTSMDYPAVASPLVTYPHDLQNQLVGYPIPQQQQHNRYSRPFGQPGVLYETPPSDSGLSSSGSDGEWQLVDPRNSFDSQHSSGGSISNPEQTLRIHVRKDSSSSGGDVNSLPNSANSPVGSFEEVYFEPLTTTVNNPTQNSSIPLPSSGNRSPQSSSSSLSVSPPVSPSATTTTAQRKKKERGAVAKTAPKASVIKVSGPLAKKSGASAGEKKVGRRRGPLRPEQRIQAGEIRKLRACLRCKFLKKTCDKGDPCAGCQPSHARLWQVPCTRIDIKDIGYFVKDWKADYDRHVTLQFSIANIRGYSPLERVLYISHGFGFMMPIQAREVFVRDEDCFSVEWIETNAEQPKEFEVATARLTAGIDGISMQLLSDYLDRHIDEGFERFIDQQFEGTLFLTEMLKTTYGYYQRTQLPVIRKALKLILAYNLTQHITIVEGLSEEEAQVGRIDDDSSKYYNHTLAPVMINFQVKHALAMMWRELQKDVLEELSALFASVYSGEKLKNWSTICVLVFILLAVWEEIQFDSHYRQSESDNVKKFCQDMENIPVGVIVGLFQAISQKLPAFQEWDTSKHHHLLYSNQAVCDAMTEIREHVNKYEDYLKTRSDCRFDRNDFDSLSNKFTSKLVIRAH